ncbi:hypothetical protein [Acidipropionibacterium jensenii]|uniref:hypothetical protein n=1 Tax=Acidipropionibacterium jensenii TaxID=1749 RepID=UPI00214CB12C|nr:hypothetical protein [Acidipropionibacterium jensenii]
MNITRSTHRRAVTLAGITAIALAASPGLTACSSTSDPSSSASASGASPSASVPSVPADAVYQFDDQRNQSTDSTTDPAVFKNTAVRIQLSDDLARAVPAGKKLTVKSYTLTVKAFPSGMCRTDIYIDYAPGGLEALKNHPDEYSYYNNNGARVLKKATVPERVGLGVGTGPTTSVPTAPSDDSLKEGDFITKDFSQITNVDKCGNQIAGLSFNDTSLGKNSTLAYADINTLENPNDPGLSVKGTVDGATIGVTGKWVPKSSSNS